MTKKLPVLLLIVVHPNRRFRRIIFLLLSVGAHVCICAFAGISHNFFFFCFFSHGIQHLTCTFVNVSFSNVRHKLLGVRGEVSTHISTCCSGARSFFISCPFRFRAQQQKTRFSVFEQSHNHSSAVEGANQKSRTHIRGSDPPRGAAATNKRKTKCIRLHFSIGVSPLAAALLLAPAAAPLLAPAAASIPHGVVWRGYIPVFARHIAHTSSTLSAPAPDPERSHTTPPHPSLPFTLVGRRRRRRCRVVVCGGCGGW